jgi:pimeloyl-ACP methyl ester carboxylesterase
MQDGIQAEDYVNTYGRLQAELLHRYGFDAHSRFLPLKQIPTRIHLLEGGSGDPVILLHGGAGIGAEHIDVAARLSKGFRVIVPDRPGHGLSDAFDYWRCDLRQASVEFIAALLDELGLERAALVGNSFGGFMAVCFALAHPERVSKLVILSFFPGIDRKLPIMMRLMVTPVLGTVMGLTIGRTSLNNTRRFFASLIVAHIDRMPAELLELETLHSLRHQRSISALFRAGLTIRGFRSRYVVGDQLAQLKVPTAFLWGELDAFATVEEGRAAAGRVPGGRFVVIPDAGHLASCDQPEVTARLLEHELSDSPTSIDPDGHKEVEAAAGR